VDFKIASRVFWVTCSANFRGVDATMRDQLLAHQAKLHKQDWHMDEYKAAWNAVYHEIMAVYRQKLEDYVYKFMHSAAGKHFKSTFELNKQKHLNTPMFQIDFLGKYDGKAGVDWGMTQVHEIFSALDELWNSAAYTIVLIVPPRTMLTMKG